MIVEEMQELIILLLLENRSLQNNKGQEFSQYLEHKCNLNILNRRYKELLDKFIDNYALNKAEKSE